MKIAENIVAILKSVASKLSGTEKRQFMAKTVNELGQGAQRACQYQLGWCRNTIRKGQQELKTAVTCIDNFQARGRKKAEEKDPLLLSRITAIVESESQADPSLKSERLYIKLSANAVRQQLIKQYAYKDDELPCTRTISKKLNENGFSLKKVRKTIPKKNSRN